jgi:rubredoxin
LFDFSTLNHYQYLEEVVRKWQCLVCSFIYEEALGLPDDGIPAGTSWDDIPDDWACPECGVGKEDFEMIEI